MSKILKINNLYKAFDGRNVLTNINFEVNEGEIFGILGLSGAGKSTLVRCLNGLENIDQGEILYYKNDQEIVLAKNNGNQVVKVDRCYKKEIAMIFQSFNLLDQRTVLKNVELPGELNKDKNRHEKALRLLELVGLSDKINAYPSTLSGGQKQRVAIARALMNNPRVLLCDEATSALDVATTKQILSLLKELSKTLHLTVLIIAHQLEVIEAICNRVVLIDASKIVEQGNVEEVFLSPKSDLGKKLIYEGHLNFGITKNQSLIKIIFKEEVKDCFVSTLIKDTGIDVSIVYADNRILNDRMIGQLILQLPHYKKDINPLRAYLTKNKVYFEEVKE